MSWESIILIDTRKKRICSAFFRRVAPSHLDSMRHPRRSLGVWMAIDFPLTPPSPPSSPSRCYWRRIFTKSSESLTSTGTMAEVDEVRAVRQGGANLTHARQTRISLCVRAWHVSTSSSCSWNIDDDVYLTRRERKSEREREKRWRVL